MSVVALPACLGGAPDWTLWILLACSLFAAGAWLRGAIRHERRWAWHAVLLLPVAAACIELAQLVPLPPSLLAALSPPAAELRDFALAPLGLHGWRPVSLDPPSTARALARTIGLGALLFTALQLGRMVVVRRRLFAAIGVAGIAVALCGFAHLIANEDALFGWYHFYGNVPLLTPFGNTNHLASFLTICSTVTLSLALDAESRDSAVGWAVGTFAIGVAVFLTLSRGGIGAFVATWGFIATLFVVQRAKGFRSALPWVIIGATLVLAGLVAFEQLVDRAETLSSVQKLQSTKVELWPMFFAGAREVWPMGLGRGAFELGFGRFQHQQLEETFTHPENLLLQWLSEVGLPLTVLLVSLSVWVSLRLWRARALELPEQVVLLGLLGVVLHDIFDFSLELNAVAVVAVVALGLVVGPAPDESRRRAGVSVRLLALVAATVACVAAVYGLPSHRVAEARLAEALRGAPQPREVSALALALIDRHPSDYILYANMANFSSVKGDAPSALAWVNRLLLLRPDHAGGHAAAGRALLRLGKRTQALLEFKTSFALGDLSMLPVALRVASAEGDYERILISQRGFLTGASDWLSSHQLPSLVPSLLERALAEGPTEEVKLEARVLLARLEVSVGAPQRALTLIDALPPEERDVSAMVATRSRVLARLGRVDEAIAALTGRLTSEPANLDLVLLLSDLYATSGRSGLAHEVLNRARLLTAPPGPRLELLLREASLWETEAHFGRALDLVQAATRLSPTRPDLRYHLATLYEHLGATRSAVDSLREGRLLDTPEGARAHDDWLARLTGIEQTSERGSADHEGVSAPQEP